MTQHMNTWPYIDSGATLVNNTDHIKSASFITFVDKNGNEILKVTEEGFLYKGKFIEDAGEAHQAFVDACHRCGL